MTVFYEISRHPGAHLAQTNKADLHDFAPSGDNGKLDLRAAQRTRRR
jgi:hypothetical protein